jgi:hypothetical protein
MIGMKKDGNDQNFSMLTLKYGEDMVNNLTKDFTPIAGVDYIPKKR